MVHPNTSSTGVVPPEHPSEISKNGLLKNGAEMLEAMNYADQIHTFRGLWKQKLKGGAEVEETQIGYSTREVANEQDFKLWMMLYQSIFTDPNDMETEEVIRAKMENGTAKLYILNGKVDNKTGGMEVPVGAYLLALNPKNPGVGYIPYGGVIEPVRNVEIFSKICFGKEEAKKAEELGVEVVVVDCEDYDRAANLQGAYEGMSIDDIKAITKRRIDYFRRNGLFFVDDPDVQYVRFSSENPQEIQAYDKLGFKIMNNADKWFGYMNPEKTHISKQGYRELYLALMGIDSGSDKNEAGLRAEFPAVNKFLTDLDSSPKEWFKMLLPTNIN